MLDQVKAAAPKHPEWKDNAAVQGARRQGPKALAAHGQKPRARAARRRQHRHDDRAVRRDDPRLARRPRGTRASTGPTPTSSTSRCRSCSRTCASNGFKTFIVSGGGDRVHARPGPRRPTAFRPSRWSAQPARRQVRAWRTASRSLTREPKIEFVDDGPGKPVGIYRSIGRRPILAFGNSDGDRQMLQWTAAGGGPRFMGIVHHTDAEREYAYDRDVARSASSTRRWTRRSRRAGRSST